LEEKILAMLEKMYAEFADKLEQLADQMENTNKTVADMDKQMRQLGEHLDDVENHMVNVESELKTEMGALLDTQRFVLDRLDRVEVKNDALAGKVERQDLRINIIESGKKKLPI